MGKAAQRLSDGAAAPRRAGRADPAAVQQRSGPEYAGALGGRQPLADGLKLLVKEDIIPARADSLLFTLGPVLVVVPVIISWLIIPFGQNLLISNVGVGIFLWVALSSIQPIGLLMSGYSSNNKYSLLGGLRAAAPSPCAPWCRWAAGRRPSGRLCFQVATDPDLRGNRRLSQKVG